MEDFLAKRFTWADYLLFALSLLISSLIGIYYAWRGSNNSTNDYLMGGRKMPILPVALSLAASSVSGTTLLGGPTDVYRNGLMYMWFIVAILLSIPVASYLYLPVFHRLQVVSANHYLEIRFNRIIRRIASVFFIVKQLLYLSMVAYGPSLALTQVTEINPYTSVAILFGVCTFYTAIGGIKAVVWTDTVQIVLMYGSIIAVIVKGITDAGGLKNVWKTNYDSGRIELLNIDFDPTVPHTVWSTAIGGFFYWMSWYGVDQTVVQRFLAMPTLRRAQITMWLNWIGISGIIFLCGFIGLLIYTRYSECDPLTAGMITKADQIVPFFVMDVLGSFPGLPGLFVAGVFSGALSSLSSILNAVALIVLEDFIRPMFPNITEKRAVQTVKVVSLVFSGLNFGMVFLISRVKTILEASISFDGAVAGSILGVFTLGISVPFANSVGAGVGMLTSFGLMMWLGLSAQIAKSRGVVNNSQLKSFSIDNCPAFNSSSEPLMQSDSIQETEEVFILLKISYLWYTVIGMVIVMVIGSLVSLITKNLRFTQHSTDQHNRSVVHHQKSLNDQSLTTLDTAL